MRLIAWDVDDVLNDLMSCWLEEAWRPAQRHGAPAFGELTANPPNRLLGVPLTDYLASLDTFRLSGRYARMAPRPDVAEWFQQHGSQWQHLALTAVPLRAASVSAEWVTRHFGTWVRSFHFVPSLRPGDPASAGHRSKEEFLRWHGKVDAFVDDSPEHVAAASRLGIPALLFPRPWNGSSETVAEVLDELQERLLS